MRTPAVLLVATVAVVAGWCAAAASGSSHRLTELAVVSYVVDGDTLDLRDGRRVRLLQIDTPELGTGECYSRKARSRLVALTPPGTRVVLESDPLLDRVDRYGRILRYLRVGGRNVNLELVRQGAAAPYFYRGEHGVYAGRLLSAARNARAARLGLWGACRGTILDPYRAVETGPGHAARAENPAILPIAGVGGGCDPSYAGVCVPPSPPDLDCADIRARGWAPVRVVGSDPHRLDGDGDGWGCE